MTDEKELLLRLRTENTKEQAFKELLSLYKERLYWHIRKIVISHDDADDVLQNTFIKVYKNIHNFKGDSKLFSWMYRIATNESITYINKRAKERDISVDEYHQEAVTSLADDHYFSGDYIQLVLQKAIATLPQKQQIVFNMKYFEALKYDQISEILDTSVGALKASYHHATKKIEEFIKNHTD